MSHLRRSRPIASAAALAIGLCSSRVAHAELPVERTFFTLASSNGNGAAMLDLTAKKITHFREHLVATEEPLIDASGAEVWTDGHPNPVNSRDLLYDAYFGLRDGSGQRWLTGANVDLDASGYAGFGGSGLGGTGVVAMVQTSGALEATTFVFAPKGLEHAGFVIALRVKNTGSASANVQAFSIHNLHMGFGRPGVREDIGENGETIAFSSSGGAQDFAERGFAGVVVARALGNASHHGASNGASADGDNVFKIVDGGGATDLPDLNGEAPTADASVSAYQWDLGTIGAGEEMWVGVAFAHHGDPFATATVQGWLDAYVGGRDAKALVDAETAAWSGVQTALAKPTTNTADEERLVRQSAVMLDMAQVQESSAYLREFLSQDGEARYTRFGTTLGAPAATLPATIAHRGKGQIIASLPPGEWTISWSRDMAYSATALATLGMNAQAKDALAYTLQAEAGRFQNWNELAPYSMPPYQVSLVRYYGFGVEETDVDGNGPNLEFDGLGLFLWATHHYEAASGDTSFVDGAWPTISTKIGDVLVALVDPGTGLIRPDSSIWETHWNGRQRSWAYTNITAVRGLCDASELAARVGDAARASQYKETAIAIRKAIAEHLLDGTHAIASNAEELAAGEGYWDAAVFEGIAMGLFDPKGSIARATFDGIDAHLAAPAGAGWSRNDDRIDHSDKDDVSPWGSEYDSAEWVVTDMRGSVAARLMGDDARAERLVKWVTDQSAKNYLAISETYDEGTGNYKFNAPMIGFGAGAYVLALAARDGVLDDAACGAYFDESTLPMTSSSSTGTGSIAEGPMTSTGATTTAGAGGSAASGEGALADGGCGCELAGGGGAGWGAMAFAAAAALAAKRRRARRDVVSRGA